MFKWFLGFLAGIVSTLFVTTNKLTADPAGPPVISLAWSEYPSWSTFGVASQFGLINGEKGQQGPIEKKYDIDIVLNLMDYDACIQKYSSGGVDAVCITNVDIQSPATNRRSVAILPTSTSDGADGLLVPSGITKLEQLKGKKIYGLAKSCSQYVFDRNCQLVQLNPDDFQFTSMDPGAAAVRFQQKEKDFDAIMVWNPFLLETLNKRHDSHVLIDSRTIPGEIIDMVVVSAERLQQPGGDRAAMAIIETFYAINNRLADATMKDDTLVALGDKFANLTLQHMRTVVRQTRFYATPNSAIALFDGQQHKDVMNRVAKFCKDREMVHDNPPIVGYGTLEKCVDSAGRPVPNADLIFDTSFIKRIKTVHKSR